MTATGTELGPSETPASRLRRAAPIAVAAAGIGLASVLAVHGPHFAGIACPWRALTGLDCPGCGSTRSLAALGDGDLVRAFDHHLLVPVVVPLLVWTWMTWTIASWGGPRLPAPLRTRGAPVAVAVAVVVFSLARNVPALEWLASGAS